MPPASFWTQGAFRYSTSPEVPAGGFPIAPCTPSVSSYL